MRANLAGQENPIPRARATGRLCGGAAVEGLIGGWIKRLSASPDVRFEAHYGLNSDIVPSPKSAKRGHGGCNSQKEKPPEGGS
jgi:hypothetical protein